jgi:HAMP domain-containing protein
MKTPQLSLIAIAVAAAFLLAASMPSAEPTQRMLISGQIEVIQEDLHGDPKAVELISDELGRFRVSTERKGDELLKHVGAWVSVFGEVEVENGIRVVHVDGFRLLPVQTRLDTDPELRY